MLKLVPSRNPPGYQISHAFPVLPPVIILFPVLGSLVGSVSLLLTLEMYVISGLVGEKTFRNQGLARIFLKPAIASLQWLNGHLILFMLRWFPLGDEKSFGTEPLNVLWRDHSKHRSCHFFLGIFGNSQWKLVVFFFFLTSTILMLSGSSDWGISIHSCFSLQGSEDTIAAVILPLYSTWQSILLFNLKESLKSPPSNFVWCDSGKRIFVKLGLPWCGRTLINQKTRCNVRECEYHLKKASC